VPPWLPGAAESWLVESPPPGERHDHFEQIRQLERGVLVVGSGVVFGHLFVDLGRRAFIISVG